MFSGIVGPARSASEQAPAGAVSALWVMADGCSGCLSSRVEQSDRQVSRISTICQYKKHDHVRKHTSAAPTGGPAQGPGWRGNSRVEMDIPKVRAPGQWRQNTVSVTSSRCRLRPMAAIMRYSATARGDSGRVSYVTGQCSRGAKLAGMSRTCRSHICGHA